MDLWLYINIAVIVIGLVLLVIGYRVDRPENPEALLYFILGFISTIGGILSSIVKYVINY